MINGVYNIIIIILIFISIRGYHWPHRRDPSQWPSRRLHQWRRPACSWSGCWLCSWSWWWRFQLLDLNNTFWKKYPYLTSKWMGMCSFWQDQNRSDCGKHYFMLLETSVTIPLLDAWLMAFQMRNIMLGFHTLDGYCSSSVVCLGSKRRRYYLLIQLFKSKISIAKVVSLLAKVFPSRNW